MIKDPICGMNVTDERFTFEIGGKKYFFCSQGCLEKFKGFSEEGGGKYVYDLVIIGAGPAGLAAAIHTSVLKIDTFVITKNIGGRTVDSVKINQFLHERYAEHRIDEVVKIARKGGIFEVITKEEDGTTAYAIIIATGLKEEAPYRPNTEFCTDLVKLDEKGEIIINPNCSTNIEGIFACGDVTGCFRERMITASEEGAQAALNAKEYLLSMGIK